MPSAFEFTTIEEFSSFSSAFNPRMRSLIHQMSVPIPEQSTAQEEDLIAALSRMTGLQHLVLSECERTWIWRAHILQAVRNTTQALPRLKHTYHQPDGASVHLTSTECAMEGLNQFEIDEECKKYACANRNMSSCWCWLDKDKQIGVRGRISSW